MDNKKKEIIKLAVNKVSLVDAGVTSKEKYGGETALPCCSKEEDRKYYPSIYVCDKEAPALKGVSAGDELTMVMKVKVTSVTINDNEKSGERANYVLEVHKMGIS